jgi:hypothetical protein
MHYQNEGANLCNMTKALGSIISCKRVGLNVVLQNFVLDMQCWNPINITHMKKILVVFIKQAQVEIYNCAMLCKACQDPRMKSFKLNMWMKIMLILDLCSYLDYSTFEISSIFLCIFLNIEIWLKANYFIR